MLEPSIVPAIIPQSLEHLFNTVKKVGDSVCEIQIDIVDGVFVPDKSWPYIDASDDEGNMEASIAVFAESVSRALSYELDLMIHDPLAVLPLWLAKKPKQLVLHIESFAADNDAAHAIEMVRENGSNAVLASGNDTPLERLESFVPHINGIQCMGIAQIGKQGNPFDMRVLGRIQTLRRAHPTLPISVDGSVNEDTIMSLKVAGANRFVVGSGIFNTPDPARAYRELVELVSA